MTSPTKDYFCDTWEYTVQTSSWKKIEVSRHPEKRRLSSMSLIGDSKVLLFGGHVEIDSVEHLYTDTWIYDGKRHIWNEIDTIGPTECNGHKMVDVGGGKVILFGGMPRAETWCFDLDVLKWEKLEIEGQSPQARHYHAMSAIGDGALVIFGGDTFNDTWIFNIYEKKWFPVITDHKSTPEARRYHDMIRLSSKHVLMHGGFMGFPNFSDTWIFDIEHKRWFEVIADNVPTPVHGFQLVAMSPTKVFRFGGFTERENSNEMWLLNL